MKLPSGYNKVQNVFLKQLEFRTLISERQGELR